VRAICGENCYLQRGHTEYHTVVTGRNFFKVTFSAARGVGRIFKIVTFSATMGGGRILIIVAFSAARGGGRILIMVTFSAASGHWQDFDNSYFLCR
jgi:hypothetical protein